MSNVENNPYNEYYVQAWNRGREEMLHEIIAMLDTKRAYQCVRTTWDASQAYSIQRELIDQLKQHFHPQTTDE